MTADGRSTRWPASWSGHRVSSRGCGPAVCPGTHTEAASFVRRRRLIRRLTPVYMPHSRLEDRRQWEVSSVMDPGKNASGTSSARVSSARTATTCHNSWARCHTAHDTRCGRVLPYADVDAQAAVGAERRRATGGRRRMGWCMIVAGTGAGTPRDEHTGGGRSRVRVPWRRGRAAHHVPRSQSALPYAGSYFMPTSRPLFHVP